MKKTIYIILFLLMVSQVYAWSFFGLFQHKVDVCHNNVTINIAESAVESHLNHGDYLGECVVEINDTLSCFMDVPPLLHCDLIEGKENYEARDLCYFEIATIDDQPSVCTKINSLVRKDWCFHDLAVARKEVCLCEQIANQDTRSRCFYNLRLCNRIDYQFLRDDCLIHLGIETEDVEVCKEISTYSDRGSCYHGIAYATKNKSVCNFIKHPDFIVACDLIESS